MFLPVCVSVRAQAASIGTGGARASGARQRPRARAAVAAAQAHARCGGTGELAGCSSCGPGARASTQQQLVCRPKQHGPRSRQALPAGSLPQVTTAQGTVQATATGFLPTGADQGKPKQAGVQQAAAAPHGFNPAACCSSAASSSWPRPKRTQADRQPVQHLCVR